MYEPHPNHLDTQNTLQACKGTTASLTKRLAGRLTSSRLCHGGRICDSQSVAARWCIGKGQAVTGGLGAGAAGRLRTEDAGRLGIEGGGGLGAGGAALTCPRHIVAVYAGDRTAIAQVNITSWDGLRRGIGVVACDCQTTIAEIEVAA